MSTTLTNDRDLRQRLREIDSQLAEKREALSAVHRELDTVRRRYSQNEDPSVLAGGERLCNKRDSLADEVESKRSEQTSLLRMLGGETNGNGNAGRNGNGPMLDGVAGDGWRLAAHELDLSTGKTRLDLDASQLLKQPFAAGVAVTPAEGLHAPSLEAAFAPLGQDRRFLYPAFEQLPLDPSTKAVTEYKQVGGRTITGNPVERDPMSRELKAQLGLGVELQTPTVRQFGVVIDEIQNEIVETIEVFQAFLINELSFQLNLAVDAHVLSQIMAAAPPVGKVGADLISQVRNGIAAMRAQGAVPTVLALNPTDAAALDLTKTELGYVFATKATGSASPLYGLTIIEQPHLTAVLVDPQMLGALYTQAGTILLDPFTKASTNELLLRVETNGLFVVRNIFGAYLIK